MIIASTSWRKNKNGTLKVIAEDTEDIWHLYNVIFPGDHVKSSSTRKCTKKDHPFQTPEKRTIRIWIQVTDVECDLVCGEIRISGINKSENDYIQKGQHHAMSIPVSHELMITKNYWSDIYLERIREATNPLRGMDTLLLLVDLGLATLYGITRCRILTLGTVDQKIPKARLTYKNRDAAMDKFYNQVHNLVLKYESPNLTHLLIGGPGFAKDVMFTRLNNSSINLKCFVAKASTARRAGVYEVLNDETIKKKMHESKSFEQFKCLEELESLLFENPELCCYGLDFIRRAVSAAAVKVLLINDTLLRSTEVRLRSLVVHLCEDVKKDDGTVIVYSADDLFGKKLEKFTGVAAILKFGLEGMDIDVPQRGQRRKK